MKSTRHLPLIARLLLAIALVRAADGQVQKTPPNSAGPTPSSSSLQLAEVYTSRTGVAGEVENETEFLITDRAVWCLFRYTGATKNDKIRLEWRNPLGAVIRRPLDLLVYGDWWFSTGMAIAGGPGARAPGEWQMRLYVNDRSTKVITFRISIPTDSLVRIASSTSLPVAIPDEPYEFRLIAQGGAPPYRWTAIKPFPEGFTLSSDGLISGHVQQRGSFRAVVKAEDSEGSSVIRTFGFGIGTKETLAQVVTSGLLRETGQDSCAMTPVQPEFYRSDARVVLAFSLKGPSGYEGTVQWLDPQGEVAQSNDFRKSSGGAECLVSSLPVAENGAAPNPGTWRVRVARQGFTNIGLFSLTFHLGDVARPAATADSRPLRLTNLYVARTPTFGEVENETEFLTTDWHVYCMFRYTGATRSDKVRIEWRNPLGAIEQTPVELSTYPNGVFGRPMQIAGGPGALAPGDWQARVYVNDRGVGAMPFRISLPPSTIVNIASATELPPFLMGDAYEFQLIAQGGTPPYRWTALKSFPKGVALSSAGLISGTSQQMGSFRAIVKLEDSAGNSVVRNFGVSVGSGQTAARTLLTRALVKATDPDPCTLTAVKKDFSPSDASVVVAFSLDAPKGYGGTVQWLDPRGEVAQTNDFRKSSDGLECVVRSLPVAGQRAASDPGTWRVRVFQLGSPYSGELFGLSFRIAGVANPSPRANRVAFLIANTSSLVSGSSGPANPDDDLLEAALHEDGFEVVRRTNVTLDNLRKLERTVSETVHAGDTVFVYYRGREVAANSDDWIIPQDWNPRDPRPIQAKAYSMLRFLQFLDDNKAGTKFLVIDASRQGNGKGLEAGKIDDSTAFVYAGTSLKAATESATSRSGMLARGLAEVLRTEGLSAKAAFEIELPKAMTRIDPSSPRPIMISGGDGGFVFRQIASPNPALGEEKSNRFH